MFSKQKNEIEAVARTLQASQLRRHRAKQFISARMQGLLTNPLSLLLPFTAGMLTGARQLSHKPEEVTLLPVPSLSKINHLLTFFLTIKKLMSMNQSRALAAKQAAATQAAQQAKSAENPAEPTA